MFRNRIASYSHRLDAFPLPGSVSPQPKLAAAGSALAPRSMILVPAMAGPASWQAQLYRIAYERAIADLAPPAHFRRYFSVWN